MSSKIALISDDSDFFDFIKLKLELRRSDELFEFCFDEVPDKINFLESAVLIVNSEQAQQKTLDLLNIFNNGTPIIVTSYNYDNTFSKKCYRLGMLDFVPILTPDNEFRARMLPALSISALLHKNRQYRQLLVRNKILNQNNEVFIKYENVIDNAILEVKNNGKKAIFGIISPDNKGKFLIKQNLIETIILNNLRKNDILINYEPNKYYLIMYDSDLISVKKHWEKISNKFPQKVYAGFVCIKNQNRAQLINNAQSQLQEEIEKLSSGNEMPHSNSIVNFKQYRKTLESKMEQLVTPIFFCIQQKYSNKFTGVKIEQFYENNCGYFNIVGKHFFASFKISNPGFTNINIDISVKKDGEGGDIKRISLNRDEFDSGLLEGLLEKFVSDVKMLMQ